MDEKFDVLDQKSWKNNIIIDGVPKFSDENIETKILGLINSADCNLTSDDLHAIFRYGSARGNKPRPIMVTLSSQKIKDTVIQNIKEIKRISGNRHLWFNKDQADYSKKTLTH